MLCDMAVSGVPILFYISYGAPDLPVTSPKEKGSHQLKDEAAEFWIYSVQVSLRTLNTVSLLSIFYSNKENETDF